MRNSREVLPLMKSLKTIYGSLCLLFAFNINAQTRVEVKLIAPIEEDRGWCLDLRGGQNSGAPIGGLHGHTCYTYNGNDKQVSCYALMFGIGLVIIVPIE